MFPLIAQIGPNKVESLERAIVSLKEGEFKAEGWDRVMFRIRLSFAGRHMLALGNWDEDRRQRVRTIIGQARHNFHLHPRQW